MNKIMMRTSKQNKFCMLKNSTGIGIWSSLYYHREKNENIIDMVG